MMSMDIKRVKKVVEEPEILGIFMRRKLDMRAVMGD